MIRYIVSTNKEDHEYCKAIFTPRRASETHTEYVILLYPNDGLNLPNGESSKFMLSYPSAKTEKEIFEIVRKARQEKWKKLENKK